MPSLASGYSFADFLLRLQRSPVSHMAPLYHAHKELFVHRPDMFSKAVMSVSWEKAVALVKNAYYTQPVAAETYRAVLARMLLHNRHVAESGAGRLVDWRAALDVYSEAVLAHGTRLPTRVTTSTLKLLAAHRQWQRSLRLLELAQVNDQLTKPMLIDAAHACATPAAWATALQLLTSLHAQDPAMLTDAIQSLRPPGTDALSVATASHSLLPARSGSVAAADGEPPADPLVAQHQQRHLVHVLNDVVSAVPGQVVLKNELCFSYLTHLVASTTLPPEAKSRMLSSAVQSLQWEQALALLLNFAEPNMLTDEEWVAAMDASPQLPALTAAKHTTATTKAARSRRKTKRNKGKRTRTESAPHVSEDAASSSQTAAVALTALTPAPAASPPPAAELVPVLRDRLQWLQCAPGAVASLLAALVSKLPPAAAADFVRTYVRADASDESLHRGAGASHGNGSGEGGAASGLTVATHSALAAASGPSAARHPIVLQALLRTCAGTPEGWTTAVPMLLEQSGSQLATPTDVLSELVLSMRAARQPALVVKLLNDHIVPSGSRLTPAAVEALLECVLAHNRACHQTILQHVVVDTAPTSAVVSSSLTSDAKALWTSVQALQGQTVHWLSALSWATNLQADTTEQRIIRTGTGASGGAESRKPAERVRETATLTPVMLNLLLGICVDAGQPLAALRALGAARDANKLELQLSEQIRALLYCVLYERPFEAESIVSHAEKTLGAQPSKPLRQLLHLAQLSKEREAGVRHLASLADDDSQS